MRSTLDSLRLLKKLEALDEEVQEGGILRHSDTDMAAVTLGATQNERG